MFIKLHNSIDAVVNNRVLLLECRMGKFPICFPQPALAAFVACMLLAGSLCLSTGCYACRVADVMTESPVVVRPTTDMTSAARLLLDTKVALIHFDMSNDFAHHWTGSNAWHSSLHE